MRNRLRLTLIIPAYNEAPCIRRSVDFIEEAIKPITKSYEIIIAEDGSMDGTDKIASDMARENPRIIHSHADERLGKGKGIKRALEASVGEIIVFMDADLATSLSHLPKLVSLIDGKYDGAIGSRHSQESSISRTFLRDLTSKTYNLLVRLLFRDGIRDHQCGFKAFSRKALESIIKDVESDSFIFDTELIVRARKKGFLIAEVPVVWEEPYGRKSKFRILEDGSKMGVKLLMLRAKLWKRDIKRHK